MPMVSVTLCAEVPELGEGSGALSWSMVEAWAVAMREKVSAAAPAVSLEQVQDQLIDSVCGPRWLPVRGLPCGGGAVARRRRCARRWWPAH